MSVLTACGEISPGLWRKASLATLKIKGSQVATRKHSPLLQRVLIGAHVFFTRLVYVGGIEQTTGQTAAEGPSGISE